MKPRLFSDRIQLSVWVVVLVKVIGRDIVVPIGREVLREAGSMVKPVGKQPGSLKDATRVCQPAKLVVCKYSFVYQNVQSSAGSTLIAL